MPPTNKHTIIIGKSQSGKSYLTKSILSSGRLGNRIIIIDTKGEYGSLPAFERVSLDDAVARVDEEQKGYLGGKKSFRWIIRPHRKRIEQEAGKIIDLAMAISRVWVVCEEAIYYGQLPEMVGLLTQGATREVYALLISQRAKACVSVTAREQVAVCLCFQGIGPSDREYLSEWWTPEDVARLDTLDPLKYEFEAWGDMRVIEKDFGIKIH